MRYLCNIGDCLLTSGICAWRVVLLWRVGGICVDNASANGGCRRAALGRRLVGEMVAGDRNFRSSDENLCLPQLFFYLP